MTVAAMTMTITTIIHSTIRIINTVVIVLRSAVGSLFVFLFVTTATLATIVPANSGTADIAQVGSGANARYVMTFFALPDYAGAAAVARRVRVPRI